MTRPVTEQAIQHPAWCAPGACEAHVTDSGYVHGEHFGVMRHVGNGYEVAVSLTTEACSGGGLGEPDDAQIALRVAAPTYLEGVDDSNKWQIGETLRFEPEEAEMLARWLLKTVAEWRDATRG
jgi:hypothetical protein